MKSLHTISSIIFSLSLLSVSYAAHAQAPAIQWEHTYGGTKQDIAECIRTTSNEDYVVSGNTNSNDSDVTGNHGLSDAWLICIDNTGKLLWQHTYGGTSYEDATTVDPTTDGGYILSGFTLSNDGDVSGYHGLTDIWVVKVTSSGALQWQKCLGGSGQEELFSMAEQIRDGGYIVGGTTSSHDGDVTAPKGGKDYWLVKLDATGHIAWEKCYGGSSGDILQSVHQTSDNGYIMAGYTGSDDGDVTGVHPGSSGFPSVDYWVVKVNDTGRVQWQKCLGGSGEDEAYNARQTADGGYIVVGFSESNDGDVTGNHPVPSTTVAGTDVWVVKLDSTGNLQWEKSLGGSGTDIGQDIQQTLDGGYIVAGNTLGANDGDVSGVHGLNWEDEWIVRLDDTGHIKWQKCLGGTNEEKAYSVIQNRDSSYMIAGSTSSVNGDVTGFHDPDTNAIYRGDYWVVKLGKDPHSGAVPVLAGIGKDIKVYPTLTEGEVHIVLPQAAANAQVQVCNLQGQLLTIPQQGNHTTERTLQLQELPKGMYLVRVTTGGLTYTYKVVRE